MEKELEQQIRMRPNSSIYHPRVRSQRSSHPRPPLSSQSLDSSQHPDTETQPTLHCLWTFKEKQQIKSSLAESQVLLDYLGPIEIPPREWSRDSSMLQKFVTGELDKALNLRKPRLPALLDTIDVEVIVWSSHSVFGAQHPDPNNAVASKIRQPHVDLLGLSSRHGPSFMTVLGLSGDPETPSHLSCKS